MLKNQKGFTLIELAIVIAILGIISVVAIPTYMNMNNAATIGALQGACGSLKSAVAIYIVRTRGSVPSIDQLLNATYLTKDVSIKYYTNTSAGTASTTAISVDGGVNSYGPTTTATPAPLTQHASITDGTVTWYGCDMTGIASNAALVVAY